MSDGLMISDERARFEQLLPFYVTNRLHPEDKAFVDAYADAHPAAQQAIAFTQKLSQIVSDTGKNRNPEATLSRLLADLQPQKKSVLLKRLLAKLRSLGLSIPLAIALLVILGQGVGYTSRIETIFVSVIDKLQIQGLIDALMETGLIEAVAAIVL